MAVIAFDFDDTLIDQLTQIVLFHNREFGTQLSRHHYTDHFLGPVWGTDSEESERRAKLFHASEEFERMEPIPGVVDVLRRLRRVGHEPHVVTGRPSSMRAKTEHLVDRHFFGLFTDLHFCDSYRKDTRVSKAVVCRRISARLLVDDVFDHAKECVDAGINALLLDLEWNRHHVDLPPNMQRIRHVAEVENFLR